MLLDKILVLPIDEQIKTDLLIPDSAKEKPKRGVVVATGDGRPNEKMYVKKGDIVYYHHSAGYGVSVSGVNHVVIKQSDIHIIE